MYPTRITIERLFGVARRFGGNMNHTEFGFACGNKKYYGLTIMRWPELFEDMDITAILEKEGDWQTLRAWVNHDTGEVVAPSRLEGPLLLLIGSFIIGCFSSLALLICLPVGLAACIQTTRKAQRIHKALVAAQQPPNDPAEEHPD